MPIATSFVDRAYTQYREAEDGHELTCMLVEHNIFMYVVALVFSIDSGRIMLKKSIRTMESLLAHDIKHQENMAKLMTKKAIVLLAPGAEELETVTIADVLARGGVEVVMAGVMGPDVVDCSRQVKIAPHTALSSLPADILVDAVVIPGGMGGATAIAESDSVKQLMQRHDAAGKVVAAICAGPMALKAHGIGKGKKATCYPALKEKITDTYSYQNEPVVVDGNMVTSRGPATAMDFGLKLVEVLTGKETADKVEDGLFGR